MGDTLGFMLWNGRGGMFLTSFMHVGISTMILEGSGKAGNMGFSVSVFPGYPSRRYKIAIHEAVMAGEARGNVGKRILSVRGPGHVVAGNLDRIVIGRRPARTHDPALRPQQHHSEPTETECWPLPAAWARRRPGSVDKPEFPAEPTTLEPPVRHHRLSGVDLGSAS